MYGIADESFLFHMGLTTYWRFIQIERVIYYKLNTSLRNQIIGKVLTRLKDGYERKQGESTQKEAVEILGE